MMTIFEFGEFFLDAFVLFLAKCFHSDKGRPDERRRKSVRDVRQSNPGLPIRIAYDPEAKWNNASGLYEPAQARQSCASETCL